MPAKNSSTVSPFQSATETEKPEQINFQGTVPEWLQGDYIRVGPGLWDLEEHTMYHFLDGYAIVAKFNFNDGKVTLTKRFLESDAYKRALAAKKPLVNEFGTRAFPDPNKGFFSRMAAALVPEISDNVYSTPFKIGSSLFLAADTSFLRNLDPCTLDTTEKYDSNKCFGSTGQSAHPMTDENGDVWQLGVSLIGAIKYPVIKIPKISDELNDDACEGHSRLKKAKAICSIPSSWSGGASATHSFGMTSKYIIMIEQPHVLCISKFLGSVLKGTDTVKDWMEWRGHEKNRFHIVEKTTGKLIKTEILSETSFYFMHIINCFEKDDQITIDVISYDSPSVLETLIISKFREQNYEDCDHPYTQRFIIPLKVDDIKAVPEDTNLVTVNTTSPSTSVCKAIRKGNQIILTAEIITEIKGAELPSFNKKLMGKPYTYYYAAGTYNPSYYSHGICKVNVNTKEIVEYKMESGFPGEPLFIPNPNGTDEDDGILISPVTNYIVGMDDFLLFLDAKTMKEIGRATFKNKIPPALHGIYLPS